MSLEKEEAAHLGPSIFLRRALELSSLATEI